MTEEKSIEVGNIFKLGTKFSESLGLRYKDNTGENKPVIMGSYGIGPGRIMGTMAELFSDKRGLVWPQSVAPFHIHLLRIGDTDAVSKTADTLYEKILREKKTVLFDERGDRSAGEKFNDADLFGIPLRIVISEKSLATGGIEVKKRTDLEGKIITEAELSAFIRSAMTARE